jgi:hypothetical protein
MRKIIQITCSGDNEDVCDRLALCDDGTVWEYAFPKWIYEETPAPIGEGGELGRTNRVRVEETKATWIQLAPIPQDKE